MNHLGVRGYREKQGLVCDTRRYLEAELTEMGFEILGDPKLCIMAFRHPAYDSFSILAQLMADGWITAVSTEPRALHLLISPIHAEVKDDYLAGVRSAVAAIEAGEANTTVEARYS